jgi:ADP-ribosylglycohydrolase
MSDVFDRAAGCLVGQAYGDALGVPYEAGVRPLGGPPQLLGGGLGNYEPGEWSDDTQMAICVANAALDADLATEDGIDAVAEGPRPGCEPRRPRCMSAPDERPATEP